MATSSQCARGAARFRGAKTSTAVNSARKTAQMTQLAAVATSRHVSEVVSASRIDAGEEQG
jgi:hypothetical protein